MADVPKRGPDASKAPLQQASTGNRWEHGAWIFRDSTLRSLEVLLDEAFRIPGTQFRFGIDGLIGLVPGIGDVIAGVMSLVIPLAAWMRGAPYVMLVRMTLNLGIGVLVGSIPFLGDAFDMVWKPNRRNFRLLQRHLRAPRRHGWRDWAFLLLLSAGLMLVFALPILVFIWAVAWIAHHVR